MSFLPRERLTRLSVVTPVYNDGACLPRLLTELEIALEGEVDEWELLIVDDGSTDGSFELMRELAEENPRVRVLRLSRNFGHQIALKCGLDHADGDAVITMDADLQHPPSLLPKMIDRWRAGYEVVAMTQIEAEGRALGKRILARAFYRSFNALSDVPIADGGSDFRLLDRKCVLALRAMRERRVFLRGLTRWIGFSRTEVAYKAARRHAGEARYTLRKLAALASSGFVSFASAPLHLGLWLGALTLIGAMVLAAVCIASPSFAAQPFTVGTLVVVLVLGALLLLSSGIIGAYVAVLLDEARRRPLYLVSETIGIEARSLG